MGTGTPPTPSNSANSLPLLNPCCKQAKNGCELATLSASQIGSAIAFLIILGTSAFGAFPTGASKENGITTQFIIFLSISICYFFFGSWFVENRYIDVLRAMGGFARRMEFIIRGAVLIFFALFSSLTTKIQIFLQEHHLGKDDPQLYALTTYLVFLYCAFVCWDLVVIAGISRTNKRRKEAQQDPLHVMFSVRGSKSAKHRKPEFAERDARKIVFLTLWLDIGGLGLTLILARLMYKDHPVLSGFVLLAGVVFACVLLFRTFPDIVPISADESGGWRSCVR
jgi:hypothetical protein